MYMKKEKEKNFFARLMSERLSDRSASFRWRNGEGKIGSSGEFACTSNNSLLSIHPPFWLCFNGK